MRITASVSPMEFIRLRAQGFRLIRIFIALFLLTLAACRSMPTPAERFERAKNTANERQWQANIIEGADFDVMTFAPPYSQTSVLSIYIEGDGLAWIASDIPSTDPTPTHFLALQLALAQPNGVSAYLARPCQYVSNQNAHDCSKAIWTDERFSARVVHAMNNAVSVLKHRFNSKQIVLVGYSGGGAIAALVAAQRDDVSQLITVAGNLDTTTWASIHRFLPLSKSLNPIDFVAQLKMLPQIHLVGLKDDVVPPIVVESFVNAFDPPRPEIRRFEDSKIRRF
ncbi:MAG: hypothetical protein JWM78_292 [Verrucomicrobiaceae bacterium]|nr:hypothetical protein [Verrucomicrobiaceae bacterium]